MKTVSLPVSSSDFLMDYHYRREGENPLLETSVKKAGILRPLWLAEGENHRYFLLDGAARLSAATKAWLPDLPAYIFPFSELEPRFVEVLHLNQTVNPLTVVEKLLAWQLALEKLKPQTAEAVADVLELSHIPSIDKTARLVRQLPVPIQQYYHRIDLSLRMLEKALGYSSEEYREWLGLSDDVHLKGPEMLSLLERVQDISLRDGIRPQVLFKDLHIGSVMEGPRTIQQKAQEVKKIVEDTRFPLLTAIRELVNKGSADLRREFEGSLQVIWDKSLERPGVILNLTLKSKQEMEMLLERLNTGPIKSQINSILDSMNHLPEEA